MAPEVEQQEIVQIIKSSFQLEHLKGVPGRLKRETYFGHFREPEDNETETTVCIN